MAVGALREWSANRLAFHEWRGVGLDAMEENDAAPISPKRDSVGYGLLAGIALHVVVGGLLVLALNLVNPEIGAGILVACGLAQLVYMLPAIGMARVRGLNGIVRGLQLVAALTFLLNASCWGLVMVSLS